MSDWADEKAGALVRDNTHDDGWLYSDDDMREESIAAALREAVAGMQDMVTAAEERANDMAVELHKARRDVTEAEQRGAHRMREDAAKVCDVLERQHLPRMGGYFRSAAVAIRALPLTAKPTEE